MNSLDRFSQPLKELSLVRVFFDRLNDLSISYCHWKSNIRIENVLNGSDDIDILVAKKHSTQFEGLIGELGFKRAVHLSGENHPGVSHFFGLDSAGTFVHLHVYYGIITGDSILKNYSLPIENLLLHHTTLSSGIRVPIKEVEFIVFLVRYFLKQRYLIDLYFVSRDLKNLRHEFEWIAADLNLDLAKKLLEESALKISWDDLDAAAQSFSQKSLFGHWIFGIRFRNQCSKYTRYSSLRAWFKTFSLVLQMVLRKFLFKQSFCYPASGGAIIAFVGPQATGKSTLCGQMKKWLGQYFDVLRIHVGKPPTTLLTLPLNILLPFARFLLPTKRTTFYEMNESKKGPVHFSVFHIIRMLALAYDRKSLLKRAFRRCSSGTIVLCDRYPSSTLGAIDSSYFSEEQVLQEKSSFRKYLMKLERRIYQKMPAPTLVVQLTVPVDIAVQRDQLRDKKGPKDSEYVRHRHSMNIKPSFEGVYSESVSTSADFSETELKVKQIIWSGI